MWANLLITFSTTFAGIIDSIPKSLQCTDFSISCIFMQCIQFYILNVCVYVTHSTIKVQKPCIYILPLPSRTFDFMWLSNFENKCDDDFKTKTIIVFRFGHFRSVCSLHSFCMIVYCERSWFSNHFVTIEYLCYNFNKTHFFPYGWTVTTKDKLLQLFYLIAPYLSDSIMVPVTVVENSTWKPKKATKMGNSAAAITFQ